MKRLSKQERLQRIKDYWPYFVIGTLSIFGAIGANIYILVADEYYHWTFSILSLIPGILFLLIWRYGKNLPQKKGRQALISEFSSGCLFTILLVAHSMWFMSSISNFEDASLYETFYQKNYYRMKEEYSHFPEQIPDHATNVKFSYSHWLGEGSLRLEYQTTPEEIQALYEKYRSDSLCIMEDWGPSYNYYGYQEACGMEFYINKSLIPYRFKTYIVISNHIDPDNDGSSDHCLVTGIAFDEDWTIVYYWSKSLWCPDLQPYEFPEKTTESG